MRSSRSNIVDDGYLALEIKEGEISLHPLNDLYSGVKLNRSRTDLLFGLYKMLITQQREEDLLKRS